MLQKEQEKLSSTKACRPFAELFLLFLLKMLILIIFLILFTKTLLFLKKRAPRLRGAGGRARGDWPALQPALHRGQSPRARPPAPRSRGARFFLNRGVFFPLKRGCS